jgi:3-isopropylmalate dehydrogenase
MAKKRFRVLLLPGDGIGPEVVYPARDVAERVAGQFKVSIEFHEMKFGGALIDETGVPITDELLQSAKKSDAVLLGAVGGPKWENLEHTKKPEAGLLAIRKGLKLFANLRPVKCYEPLINSSTLKPEVIRNTDLVVVRELTGGIYFGKPRGIKAGKKGYNTEVYKYKEVERIARMAFEIARKRRKKVTSVDKANVLESSQFWRDIVNSVHKDYADVLLNHMYVDNCAMQLIRNPEQFDVILTNNIFGDILSDEAAMLTGSIGMLPSASLGDRHALYEPIHGSAPDIAGKNIANPLATILSVAMMFKFTFNMPEASERIEKAVEDVLKEGYRTQDIYTEGCIKLGTQEMAGKIIERLSA